MAAKKKAKSAKKGEKSKVKEDDLLIDLIGSLNDHYEVQSLNCHSPLLLFRELFFKICQKHYLIPLKVTF